MAIQFDIISAGSYATATNYAPQSPQPTLICLAATGNVAGFGCCGPPVIPPVFSVAPGTVNITDGVINGTISIFLNANELCPGATCGCVSFYVTLDANAVIILNDSNNYTGGTFTVPNIPVSCSNIECVATGATGGTMSSTFDLIFALPCTISSTEITNS